MLGHRPFTESGADNSRPSDARLVVPIPLHPVRKRDRGFNQAEAIATGVAQKLRLETLPQLLIRKKLSASQVGRTRTDRLSSLIGVFGVRQLVRTDIDILLVDDVITTGATMIAAIDALHTAGYTRVEIAALALAPG